MRTERQLQRCELARREFIAMARQWPIVRADFITVDEGEGPCRVPKCYKLLHEHGLAWGQIADGGDNQLIYVKSVVPVAVRRLPGVALEDVKLLKFDDLIKPFADKTIGHFSYAHTSLAYSEDFEFTADPLSDDADWTALENGSYVKSDSGGQDNSGKCAMLKYNASGIITGYKNVGYSPSSADYSVEALCRSAFGGSTYGHAMPALRITASDTYYFVIPNKHDSATQLRKIVSGSVTQLASGTWVGNPSTMRIEAVGSTLKAYEDGTERCSASDSSITAAGEAGFRGWNYQANEIYPWIDDFKVYVEAGGATYPGSTRGRYAICVNRGTGETRGRYRLADANSDKYQLWDGIDGSPDLSAAPDVTGASLPLTRALSAGHKHHIVVRERNPHGLVSQNRDETIIELDGSGNQVNRPSAPENAAVEPAAAGAVTVTADYFYPFDTAAYRADQFLIYLTSNGTDPDPATDSPTVVSLTKTAGVARLDWTSGALGDGLTVKVIVRTRRSGSPNVDSDNSDIVSCTTSTDGPSTPGGDAFFGNIAMQGQ